MYALQITFLRSDADSAYMLRAYGRFYHYLTTYQLLTSGLEAYLGDCSVVITFLDDDGNILEDNYKPEWITIVIFQQVIKASFSQIAQKLAYLYVRDNKLKEIFL